MAANDSIRPFPADIDREGFGHWLSGFVDGEGCFLLQSRRMGHSMVGYARFVIKLRTDDTEIIELIRDYWGVGYIGWPLDAKSSGRVCPQVRYQVQRTDDLVHIIAPHFERHPLRAKKRRDFAIWKEALSLLVTVRSRPRMGRPDGRPGTVDRWREAERVQFESLASLLKD